MRWYNSLIFKIILCCVVLTFCLIGSIVGVLFRYQHSIVSEMEQRSSEILEAIQVDIRNLDVEEISENVLQKSLPDLKDRHGVDSIVLYDSERNIVTSIRSDETPILGFGDSRAYVANVEGLGGRKTTRYLQTLPLMIGSKQVGFVRIMLDIVPQTHLIKALRSKVLIVLMLLFFGTILALCYFIFRILQPLRAMAATCDEICEGNLHEIDVKPNASEVLALEMKFNEMVNALKTKAEIEQKLVLTQRLSALGNLAAGVAHEIGNPLNGIKLTISHLKDIASKHELDEASFDKYAGSMLNEVNRLDRIVKDFLMLAKERELSPCPYEIRSLLEEILQLIEKEAQKKGLRITSNIPVVTREVLIDPQLLKSAILNLLINAMEASEENGSIKVSLAESDKFMLFKVTDEGKGIPEDIMGQVFEPYFSTKSTGTGLGLSLTKTIIEKHGGEISIESHNGQGTTATFTIPIEGK